MKKFMLLVFRVLVSFGVLASVATGVYATEEGVDCESLPEWSGKIDGYEVNLHHVFCGESGKRGKAKGFHAMPGGDAPSSYISSTAAGGPNGAGVYTLKDIKLKFHGASYKKSFSSMFPDRCSQDQISKSIVYSLKNSTGSCASPGWATCGPNAPKSGGDNYCVADDGSIFSIASAVLNYDKTKINTGFPIYRP